MSTCRSVCAVLALGLVASAVPLRAQGQSPDVMLARAVAALEATETERGVELLRQLVATLPPTAPGALRRDAQLRLAVACGSLGLFDSATVHFQAAIGADPFTTLDPEQFNPDLLAVFRAAKRATLALGVRAPPDTALAPRIERWPVSVAVTRPGTVRFRLARPGPAAGSRDTVIATAAVESLATIALLLPAGDGVASAAGAYRLAVDYSEPGGRTVAATLSLELTEQVADSAPHEPPPADSLYRLEVRWAVPDSLFRRTSPTTGRCGRPGRPGIARSRPPTNGAAAWRCCESAWYRSNDLPLVAPPGAAWRRRATRAPAEPSAGRRGHGPRNRRGAAEHGAQPGRARGHRRGLDRGGDRGQSRSPPDRDLGPARHARPDREHALPERRRRGRDSRRVHAAERVLGRGQLHRSRVQLRRWLPAVEHAGRRRFHVRPAGRFGAERPRARIVPPGRERERAVVSGCRSGRRSRSERRPPPRTAAHPAHLSLRALRLPRRTGQFRPDRAGRGVPGEAIGRKDGKGGKVR